MAITQVWWNWFSAWGNGYQSIDINIPPSLVIAQATLHGASGGGATFTGIRSYRKRLANGTDQNIDFGDWTGWPPLIFDTVSSVTFGIATGSDQQAWMLARIEQWS